MAKVQTSKEVGVEETQRRLSEALGPRYRVTIASDFTLKVGARGMLSSHVTLSHANGGTTFSVQTTGLIVSRLIQAATINPKVKRALSDAFASTSSASEQES
jgi:hypothetical protein